MNFFWPVPVVFVTMTAYFFLPKEFFFFPVSDARAHFSSGFAQQKKFSEKVFIFQASCGFFVFGQTPLKQKRPF